MRRSILTICAALLLPSYARSQTTLPQHQSSLLPAEARYEIIQSTLAVKFTLRVDRFTGTTAQLVLASDSSLTWQDIARIDHFVPDTRVPARVNYQVFTSGLGLRFTFLLNVNTGATWQITEDPKTTVVFWNPLK